MRAEQAIMLGVGAIGLYAAYRLLSAKPEPPPPDAFLGPIVPTNPRDARIDPSLPLAAGRPGLPPDNISVLNGNALPLRGGAYYKARIETDPSAENGQIQAFVSTALGVPAADVEVFRTAAEAMRTNAIGQPFAVENPGRGTRWIRFRVPAMASGTRTRLPWIIVIWQAAPPSR